MARRGCAGDTLARVTRLPRYFLTSAVLVISLATSVCFVSNNLNSRVQHRDETVAQQVALIAKAPLPFDGQPSDQPEFRNRVLFPLAMVGVARLTGLENREAFLLVRWVSAVFCFATLVWFSMTMTGNDIGASALAAALLALFFVTSFNHPWEHPTDFPDATAMILGAWASIRRRLLPALAVAAIAAANRESAVFVGIVWIAVTTIPSTPARAIRILQGVAMMVLTLSVTLILRRVFALPGAPALNSVAENPLLPMLRDAIRHPFLSWAMLLVASVAPTLAIIGARWRGPSETSQRMVMAAGFVGAVSLAVGAPDEIRILTPAATMLVCSLVIPCQFLAE